jgi:hypothetical protein
MLFWRINHYSDMPPENLHLRAVHGTAGDRDSGYTTIEGANSDESFRG